MTVDDGNIITDIDDNDIMNFNNTNNIQKTKDF